MAEGLGDTIENLTIKTGIKKLVPKNCGCNKRRKVLNKLVPYNKKKDEK